MNRSSVIERLGATGVVNVCLAHGVYDLEAEWERQRGTYNVSTHRGHKAIIEALPTVDVLVISGLTWTDDLLESAPRLRFIQSTSAGIERFPVDDLVRRKIRLASAQGVNMNAVSDHGMALILSLSRKLHEAAASQGKRQWRSMNADLALREQELEGKTLVIVGMGGIGSRLARLAQAFGMKVIGVKRSIPADHDGTVTFIPSSLLLDAISQGDFVALTCPLTPETRGLISEAELRAMKPNAYLINIARGGVVDENALLEALTSHRIGGAALDCFLNEPLPSQSPFWSLPNVIVTAHVAGETQRYEANLIRLLLHNINALQTGGALVNEVT